MENTHAMSALRQKRAELAGSIKTTEQQAARLRSELAALDTTIRLFDPEFRPESVRPVIKRQSPRFKTGELIRAILGILRKAEQPMTARQIAVALAETYGTDMSTPSKASKATNHVNVALQRERDGVIREGRPGYYTWRLE